MSTTARDIIRQAIERMERDLAALPHPEDHAGYIAAAAKRCRRDNHANAATG